MTSADAIFGPAGLLSRKLPSYEHRAGQQQMAEAVARAIADKRHLAIEAPCGIGKSFAYLIPAIRHAVEHNERVIVCTANIALQEQLHAKDLPVLAGALEDAFRFALIKGLNNYLCLDRFEETRGQFGELVFSPPELQQWNDIVRWRDRTAVGDVSELPFAPSEAVWNRVNGVTDLCNGPECRFYDECFAMEARRRLKDAHIIVTNYHIFLAHLAIRRAAGRDVLLPSARAVVCDEAHELADIARDFFGRRLSPYSVNLLVQGANLFRLSKLSGALRQASQSFFAGAREYARSSRYRVRLREPGFVDGKELVETVTECLGELEAARQAAPNEEVADKAAKLAAAAARYRETLRSFLALDDPNLAYYVSDDAHATHLVARVIDVSAHLRESLFEAVPSVVLTSATLTSGNSFDYVKRETGVGDAAEARVASPFDFRRQALLVVPPVQAEPNSAAFAPEISRHINGIVQLLAGRTMALFTSYRNMQFCAEEARKTGVEILKQGDAPRSTLLERFRRNRGTALFATASFWQGVDVPGDALSCLVIDKIPFTPPDDPVLDAIQERDPDAFRNYSLPRAAILLAQGFGRLIRTKTDRGAVVIFDNRLLSAGYGSVIRQALPNAPLQRDLRVLKYFFAGSGPARLP